MIIPASLIFAALLVASCTNASAAVQVPSHKTSEVQYLKIKAAIQKILDGPGLNIPYYPDAPKMYDLKYCFDGSDLLSDSDPRVVPTTIALYVGLYRNLMDKLHIPRSVAGQTFASMEALAIATLENTPRQRANQNKLNFTILDGQLLRLQIRFRDDLRRYAKNKTGMPKFEFMGECGAGLAEISITTTPPGATVSYIPLFQYALCDHKGINPKDPDKCEGWLTATTLNLDIVGIYHYLAVWPDGRQKRGKFAIHGIDAVCIRQ